jgi:alkylhydroperoxidase family enzyme
MTDDNSDQTSSTPPATGFLAVPEASADVQRLYDDDLEQMGFVMNASKVWAHLPAVHDELFELIGSTARAASLTFRQRGILITACASTIGDSYCSLAWGKKLADHDGAALPGLVLRGEDDTLEPAERALAAWARSVARDPNGIGAADVQAMRDAGFDDGQIFAITTFVALRIAFSTVNDALGARPDRELGESAPPEVLAAVTYGRPVG